MLLTSPYWPHRVCAVTHGVFDENLAAAAVNIPCNVKPEFVQKKRALD